MKHGDDFIEFDNSTCSNNVLDNLNKLRKNKQFCDVIIQVCFGRRLLYIGGDL